MAETDNSLAATAATLDGVLDLRALQLLGVMEAHDGLAALLRSPRGEIARLQVGEEAFGIRITAIGADHITVTDSRGQSGALALPQG